MEALSSGGSAHIYNITAFLRGRNLPHKGRGHILYLYPALPEGIQPLDRVFFDLFKGMLAFFLFRRTAVQVTYAVDSNRPLFTYRQVKPFDPAIARAVLEAFLMAIIAGVILLTAALLGHDTFPADTLLVMQAVFGLWLFGIGYGLVASVLMALVPEMEHVLKIVMLPLYLISGVIWPLASIPMPYRDILMINPIAHGLELVRMGFFPYYHTVPGLSMPYLFAWGVVSIFLGLLLYRRFAIQMVMR